MYISHLALKTEPPTNLSRGHLTETESFRVARLEYEGEDGDDGEETARQDEVDDVVERLATQAKRERDARVRRLAAVVPHLRLLGRHL